MERFLLWGPVGSMWDAVYKLDGDAFDRASDGLAAAIGELQEAGLLAKCDESELSDVGLRSGTWTVDDIRGGTWWPSESASEMINASNSPRELAVSLAREGIKFGEWRA